jgi:hypothetical protein
MSISRRALWNFGISIALLLDLIGYLDDDEAENLRGDIATEHVIRRLVLRYLSERRTIRSDTQDHRADETDS